MLRMGHRNTKESVARKKATKLRAKTHGFPVYVSRIRLAQDQFEVVLQPEQVPSSETTVPLQSSSTLRAGDEVRGTVVRVEPYGCLVALDGYNRPGLLHIQRVADLYGRYIDRVTGLEEAGLERQSRVRLQVVSNERKRLFLDFTDDVKQEAAAEAEQKAKDVAKSTASSTTVSTAVSSEMSAQELAEWEAHYSNEGGDDEEEEDEDEDEDDGSYDDYDEERDIEDALGLGTY